MLPKSRTFVDHILWNSLEWRKCVSRKCYSRKWDRRKHLLLLHIRYWLHLWIDLISKRTSKRRSRSRVKPSLSRLLFLGENTRTKIFELSAKQPSIYSSEVSTVPVIVNQSLVLGFRPNIPPSSFTTCKCGHALVWVYQHLPAPTSVGIFDVRLFVCSTPTLCISCCVNKRISHRGNANDRYDQDADK